MLLQQSNSLLFVIDVQEKLLPAVCEPQSLQQNCLKVVQLAQSLSIPIIASEQYPQGLGGLVNSLRSQIDHQQIVAKNQFSCGSNENCLNLIMHQDCQQIILTGLEAHVCVLQTAVQLTQENKQVFVIDEAISSRYSSDKTLAIRRMHQYNIQVISLEMVFFEWLRSKDHPKFKQLAKQFLT